MEILTAVLYVICTAIRLIVGFLQAAMFIRAILSWFMPDEEHMLMRLLYAVTEPAVMPVRALLYRFGVGDDAPFDIAFFVTMLALMVIEVLLPAVTM